MEKYTIQEHTEIVQRYSECYSHSTRILVLYQSRMSTSHAECIGTY